MTSSIPSPHSMDDAVETLRRFIDHTDFYGPTKKAVDAHEALTSLVEQYEGVKREIEVLRQTCAISFSGKDAGIATLIRRAESAEEQLEALKADNERLRSRLTYLLIDPNPLTPEELENLREIVGLPRVPNPAKERS